MPTAANHPNDDGNLLRVALPGQAPFLALREQVAELVLMEVPNADAAYRATLATLQTALDRFQYTADLERRLGLTLAPALPNPATE